MNLKEKALAALAEADPTGPGGLRMQATNLLREMDGQRLPLTTYIAAIDWAARQDTPPPISQERARALAELARRVVALDEPDSTERRTVTLNQIIGWARKALGATTPTGG